MSKFDTILLWTERRAAANKGFAIAGVPCFADTFVQGGSSVLRMNFSAKTPRHRKPPKRDDLFKKNGIPEKMNFLGTDYEINPDAMVFSQQGLDKYQGKDYSEAVTAFTKTINAQLTNQNFYTMRGTAYEDMGNDIEAEKDFRKTLAKGRTSGILRKDVLGRTLTFKIQKYVNSKLGK